MFYAAFLIASLHAAASAPPAPARGAHVSYTEHTLTPHDPPNDPQGITRGPDGAMWFTE